PAAPTGISARATTSRAGHGHLRSPASWRLPTPVPSGVPAVLVSMSVASFCGPRNGYRQRRGRAAAGDRAVVQRPAPAEDPVGVGGIGEGAWHEHADRD